MLPKTICSFDFKKYWWAGLLLFYHLGISAIAYHFITTRGGDSLFYWFLDGRSKGTVWSDWFPLGNGVMIWLDYIPAQILNLPLWFGFIIYSLIGFTGIIQFYRLGKSWLGSFKVYGIDLLVVILFLPNFHFWTGHVSKEVWCFLWIATILLKLYHHDYRSWQLWVCCFLLLVLRPHVALMLGFPTAIAYLFFGKMNLKRKFFLGISGTLILSLAFYGFLLLAGFRTFDWERILYYNDYSILSFKRAGSYVPMLEYTYPMKLFSFYFRPLFENLNTVYYWALSFQNGMVLCLHGLGLFLIMRFYNRIKWDRLSQIILIYVLVAGLIYVQRYAALGIFVRTKIMIQPFMLLLIIKILRDVFQNGNAKNPYAVRQRD